MKSKDLALTAIFASLYSILVLALSSVSFEIIQVRIADALIPLSMIFGWPAIIGVSLGCIVGNVVSPLPSVLTDMTLGALANFLASYFAWRIIKIRGLDWKNIFLGCGVATVTVTFIVGTYLSVLSGVELWIWLLGVGAGSVISMVVLGYTLVQGLIKAKLTTIDAQQHNRQ